MKFTERLEEYQINGDLSLKDAYAELKEYAEKLEDKFFKQTFQVALNGILANSWAQELLTELTEKHEDLIYKNTNLAKKYAQESVRQVGELNKPQCEKSPSGLHRYKGIDIGNGTCIYCEHKEQARDS
ncbi:MAG: hypothetical protein K0R66_1717 [Gammaproteobacteria bacterium]|jgi:hypothetical protein|nr:hypothetical protein [Gammaproteobacteria bacterium]